MTNFLALDFETSGSDPSRNAPIQIGIAEFRDGVIHQTYQSIIGVTRRTDTNKITAVYDVAALEISQITWNQIKNGPQASKVLSEIEEYTEWRHLPIVAFRAPFDCGFWDRLLGMHFVQYEGAYRKTPRRSPLLGGWHCAHQLAQAKLTLPNYTLDAVSQALGLGAQEKVHGALPDAVRAGRVWLALNGGAA
ncbi:hypothetical protein [Microcystis phage Mae-JY24]